MLKKISIKNSLLYVQEVLFCSVLTSYNLTKLLGLWQTFNKCIYMYHIIQNNSYKPVEYLFTIYFTSKYFFCNLTVGFLLIHIIYRIDQQKVFMMICNFMSEIIDFYK